MNFGGHCCCAHGCSPEARPAWWSKFKDPVCPLRLALYGHPDSGGHWEAHCEKIVTERGFVPISREDWRSVFWHPKLKLMLVVYVDDFKLAGPKENLSTGWELLRNGDPKDPAMHVARPRFKW